jgi:NAD(P)-dependent dehydrogenase (short-subunit alcohol dehydrogenase family)/fatty acid desaturase
MHTDPDQLLMSARRQLTDLFHPKAWVFWTDLAITSSVMWAGLIACSRGTGWWPLDALAFTAAALATFRAAVLLHEITHLPRSAIPGIRLAWNAVVGVPLLLPSFIFERMHMDHHRRQIYGTRVDPEYLPHARNAAAKTVFNAALVLLLPAGLFVRWAIVAPISFVHPRLRACVLQRLSTLSGNPAYRAERLTGRARVTALASELACAAWAWACVALLAAGALPLRALWVVLGLLAAAVTLNQLHAFAAHRFESDGSQLSVARQLADSVNVTADSLVARLLLPCGIGFHALHHFCPALPYHALREAHRRLLAALPEGSVYHRTVSPGLFASLAELLGRGTAYARATSRSAVPVAIVSGASSGFGLLTAVELARAGHRVVAGLRDTTKAPRLLEAARAAGVDAAIEVVRLDFADPATIAGAVAKAGHVDVLVNNAGIAIGGFFEDTSEPELREQFEANFFGLLALTRAVLPPMRERRSGRIVNVSSLAARVASPGLAAYCASKCAVEGASEALRHELRPMGIDVVLVEPGSYPTEIFGANRRIAEGALRVDSPYAQRTARIQCALEADLLRRRADPSEVARAIVRVATQPKPPLRYVVGSDARFAVLARRMLPERTFERLVARHFDRPAPAAHRRPRAGAALVVAIALAAGFAARADDPKEQGWETVVHGPITVKTRPRAGTHVNEYWVEGELNAPLVDVQEALTDPQSFPRFMPYVKEARVIGATEPDGSTYVYTKLDFPIFVASRDYVVRVAVDEGVRSDGGGAFRQRWVAAASRLPERSGVVRIKLIEGSWHIVARGDDRVFAVHRFAVDPGGRLPAFSVDLGNRSGTIELFRAVEKDARRRCEVRKAMAHTN